ncbi:MAG: hypothetical protein R2831_03715 [Chitinophagaceae bacterium]
MKQYLIILALLLLSAFANAQQPPIMLCNPSGTICTPYYSLDSAINDANNGDYVYLPAGTFVMPTSLSKEITIYGVGANLDSCNAIGGTTNILNQFNLDASNITLEGINFLSDIVIGTNTQYNTFNNIKLIFCKLPSLKEAPNYISRLNNSQVIACYFTGHLTFGAVNFNNAFGSQGSNNFVSNCVLGHLSRAENSIIKNCIFNALSWPDAINIVYSSTLDNCVFNTTAIIAQNSYYGYPSHPNNNVIQNCYYKNNLFYNTYNGGFGSTYLNNQVVNSTIYNPNNSTYPFNIAQAGANIPFPVGHSADIQSPHPASLGINGGMFPWSEHGCVPSNPHVFYKNIADKTNGSTNLPVNIKVRSGN